MRDVAREYTDRELHKLTKELERVYNRALSETQAKWNKFIAKHEAKANELWQAVQSAKNAGDAKALAEAKAAYTNYLQKTTFGNTRYKQTVDEIATRLAHIDQQTYRTVNRLLPDIYAKNYNSLQLPEHYVLKIVDPNTVTNLALKDIKLLKDVRWNVKRLNAEILQGIMQGESMDKIAMRLRPFVGGNKAAALRNARTAVTSAENAGRMDSMLEAERELGLIYKKQWVATNDDRTRDSHAEMNGETVDADDEFSNGCAYPGDPAGEPSEVYNCFVADTNIATDSNIIRSYKHKYYGDLYTVKTAAGVCFTCTPNHPVLTPNGWISVNSLHEGDDLIITSGCNGQVSGRNPHINHRHSRIDTIHQFLYEMGGKRTCALGVDFHGDVAASDVEIVRSKRLLGFNLDSGIGKRLDKFLLKDTDAANLTDGAEMQSGRGIRRTSTGILSGLRKAFAFIGRGLFHADKHSGRTVPNVDFILPQNAINDGTAESILLGKGFYGNAAEILADKVISIDVKPSHCFVYNLQTKNGYYLVNSITQNNDNGKRHYAIAHNCRCTMNRVLWGIVQADGRVKRV